MRKRIHTSGLCSKVLILAVAMVLGFSHFSFGRVGVKLFSIGNNVAWNSPGSWSLTLNGEVCTLVPQSTDTVVINSSVIQNVNFSFTGNGLLEVSPSGTLRGDALNLNFTDNSGLNCSGEINTGNMNFSDNSYFLLFADGSVLVNNMLTVSSSFSNSVYGKLIVAGTLNVSEDATIIGKGSIEAAVFYGNGSVFNFSPVSLAMDGTLISEKNWTGNLDNNWNEPSNWSGNELPNSGSNISVLPSAHKPVISGSVFCGGLYINTGAELQLNPEAFLETTGDLSVIGNGKLIMKNTLSEKSSIIVGGNTTGKIQVEYPVVANQHNLISSPVSSAVSGTFLNMYLRQYDEVASQWGEYIVPTNDPLEIMRGYELLSLFGETRIFEGTPNQGSKTIAISNSGNGLNLAGNPFPSYIDWENTNSDAWQRNSVAAAIYYPDPSGSGNFAVFLPGGDDAVSLNNGSRFIAPMQGFFVKAGSQGTLTVSESSRVRNISDSKVVLKNNSLKFRLSNTSGLNDEVLFRVHPNSTFGFDNDLDAIKFQGNVHSPSISLQSNDETKYAVSSVPTINSSLDIPLNVECDEAGMYSINVTGSFNFEYRYPVILEDKALNSFIDLRSDSVYSFYHSPEMDSKRFEIHFNSPEGISEQESDLLTEVLVSPGEVRVSGNLNEMFTVKLFTTEGRLISTGKGILSEGIALNTGNNQSSICLLQIFNGKQTVTKKILTR